MTDKTVDVYYEAVREYSAAKPGARAQAFVKMLVAERALLTGSSGLPDHLWFFHAHCWS